MSRINRTKRNIKKKGFAFEPLRPEPDAALLLKEANLKPDAELLAFERNGERRLFALRDMLYHHVAQGKLAGEPYLVTF